MTENKSQLIRGLTLTDTTALVIGTVIGTGVFLKAAPMAQGVGSPMLVLAAWVAAGLLSLAGALTYAELGAMMPEAGGEYVYFKRIYGFKVYFSYKHYSTYCILGYWRAGRGVGAGSPCW